MRRKLSSFLLSGWHRLSISLFSSPIVNGLDFTFSFFFIGSASQICLKIWELGFLWVKRFVFIGLLGGRQVRLVLGWFSCLYP